MAEFQQQVRSVLKVRWLRDTTTPIAYINNIMKWTMEYLLGDAMGLKLHTNIRE